MEVINRAEELDKAIRALGVLQYTIERVEGLIRPKQEMEASVAIIRYYVPEIYVVFVTRHTPVWIDTAWDLVHEVTEQLSLSDVEMVYDHEVQMLRLEAVGVYGAEFTITIMDAPNLLEVRDE